jgi:uncharacterized protein
LYIRVSDIPREGLDVFASRGKALILKVLEGMDPFPLKDCRLTDASLVLSVEGRNLFADGTFTAEGEGACDRCTETFKVAMEKDFHTILVPGESAPAKASNVELHEDDLEIGFYDGGGIEVNDVFWEQVALTLPVKLLCKDDCRGICPKCGGNLNLAECGCPGPKTEGPFDILRKLKEEKE